MKRWFESFWNFLVIWTILNAAGIFSGGVALGIITLILALAAVLLFFQGWLGVLFSLLLMVPTTLAFAVLWVCTWIAPLVRRIQSELTHRWLIGPGRHSREVQEQEAAMILEAWKTQPSVSILNPIRATIWWQVLDSDGSSGTRLLVRPLFDWRLCALVGEDPHTKRPFFMAVPPRIRRVSGALEWLWDLPRGTWMGKSTVSET